MPAIARFLGRTSGALALALSLVCACSSTTHRFTSTSPLVTLTQISRDPYTNKTSQHQTEVEPATFAFGNMVVAAFKVGRFFKGGASNIGWATSITGGRTWTHGFLPGTTVFAGGPYDQVSDPSVAYDARHNVWMISYLAHKTSPATGVLTDVLASRSTNGGVTWSTPVLVKQGGPGSAFDKDWIVCDDTATSPFYGHCYSEFDEGCCIDLVLMSTSTDGKTWSAVRRIPLDPVGSGVDHFIPGLAIDQSTPGSTGHLVLAFYYYANGNCTSSTCQLDAGSSSSTDGGTTWSSTNRLAGPMTLSWLASTSQGAMVGDYISTSFSGGKAYPVFVVATAPRGGVFNEAMFTVSGGFT